MPKDPLHSLGMDAEDCSMGFQKVSRNTKVNGPKQKAACTSYCWMELNTPLTALRGSRAETVTEYD